MILALLPHASSGTTLEVGCAEGFITKSLPQRFDRFVACELSETVIDRARSYCGDCANIEFYTQDIRCAIPAQGVQVCLVSDVLYYLSPRERTSFVIELASRMNFSGQLIFCERMEQKLPRLNASRESLRGHRKYRPLG
jgi:16S rRNA A1518/A1519 N6-dimethyltransferase RsmA/KsgA/DIM1 with predicted DNA glycosylase/AP lyase activity